MSLIQICPTVVETYFQEYMSQKAGYIETRKRRKDEALRQNGNRATRRRNAALERKAAP